MKKTNTIIIYKLNKLENNIKKYGIERVLNMYFKENDIKTGPILDMKNPYISYLKEYSKKIDKKMLIQDLSYGLPNFNDFSSLDFLNWIFNVKINQKKLENKTKSNYFFWDIHDVQKEESIEKINELLIIILNKIKKHIIYKKNE